MADPKDGFATAKLAFVALWTAVCVRAAAVLDSLVPRGENVAGSARVPLSFTRLMWNGTPLEIRPERVQQDNTRYLRFADLDGDGDLDMVETNFYEQVLGQFVAENPRIFWNRLVR